jgi:hypothetical protein
MTRDVSTKRFPLPAAPLLLWVLLLSVAVFLPARVLAADAKRGHEPRCQEECLKEHADKMKLLSEEYTKIRNRMGYQDQVEIELQSYSHCLTNCRELLPIK